MATVSTIADDFDGTTPAESYSFIVGDKEYMIDLSEENAKEFQSLLDQFEEKMTPYIRAGRALGKANPRRSSSSNKSSGPDPKLVRAWAEEEGIELNSRGRIPANIIEQYENRKKKS